MSMMPIIWSHLHNYFHNLNQAAKQNKSNAYKKQPHVVQKTLVFSINRICEPSLSSAEALLADNPIHFWTFFEEELLDVIIYQRRIVFAALLLYGYT